MATKNKKLSRAKAEAAYNAIATLLEGTEHDERMSFGLRSVLINTNIVLEPLIKRLREDERESVYPTNQDVVGPRN